MVAAYGGRFFIQRGIFFIFPYISPDIYVTFAEKTVESGSLMELPPQWISPSQDSYMTQKFHFECQEWIEIYFQIQIYIILHCYCYNLELVGPTTIYVASISRKNILTFFYISNSS